MATVTAGTRQRLTEIAAKLDNKLFNDAQRMLLDLLKSTSIPEVMSAAPDISELIDRFYKQKKRMLMEALKGRVESAPATPPSVFRSASGGRSAPVIHPPLSLRQEYGMRLKTLGEQHIFQWANHYRDAIHFIFNNTHAKLRSSAEWHSVIEDIGEEFSIHALDIFGRGYEFQVNRGLTAEIAEIKSVTGLQNFLYYIVLAFTERREHTRTSRDAQLLWALVSSVLTGVLRGYGGSTFGQRSGWSLLQRNLRIWLPPMGFARGSDAVGLLEAFPVSDRDKDMYVTVLPTLLAIERLANRFHGTDVFLPRLSRVSISEPARLDITLTAKRESVSHEVLVTCFFNGIVDQQLPISDALSLHAAAVVGQFGGSIKSSLEHKNDPRLLNALDVLANTHQAQGFSELIHAQLDSQTSVNLTASDPSLMSRNYASEFPLDDPDFRRDFLVERQSVKKLLQQIEGSNGVHLWCSVRRSGKTTAASSLVDPNGSSVVVMQSMDQLPKRQLEQNIFKRRLKEAFSARDEIDAGFFQSVVDECVLAATNTKSAVAKRRTVFILDEYETLFGVMDAHVSNDPGLRFMVALPLLSQMAAFASQNLLIFMGQRPDAYLILSAQSQLSPLVRQYNFPLFEHIVGAVDTEFTQFLRRVLREKLPFAPSFSNEVYEETSGHPYLTANLMVDFCDWLIVNGHRHNGEILDSTDFVNFRRDRLAPAKLRRSPRYEFFNHMLAEYLSERGREQEPWLSAITSVLQQIAEKHPVAFACPINKFDELASPFGAATRMTPARLLTSGALANFLHDEGGKVKPGVRLLARLAGTAAPNIN